MESGDQISQSLKDGLNLSLVMTPQPVFSMMTTDKFWSGFTARFSVVCVSLNSDTDPETPGPQKSVAIDSFVINVTDECALTEIYGA